MPQLVKELLNSKSIHPSAEELSALTAQWQNFQELRGNLPGIQLGEADIALCYVPGGGQHEH